MDSSWIVKQFLFDSASGTEKRSFAFSKKRQFDNIQAGTINQLKIHSTEPTSTPDFMKALLIVAHGSRKIDANQKLEDLTTELAETAKPHFDRVVCAFLQFNGPYAADVIAELVAAGIDHIVVFPFFLAEGSHVTSDIPALVQTAGKQYPGVVFETAPFLGEIKELSHLVLKSVLS